MCLINHSSVKEITHLIVRLCRLLAKKNMKIHSFMALDSKLSYGGACDESFRTLINIVFPLSPFKMCMDFTLTPS
jgi:hypothetical protein